MNAIPSPRSLDQITVETGLGQSNEATVAAAEVQLASPHVTTKVQTRAPPRLANKHSIAVKYQGQTSIDASALGTPSDSHRHGSDGRADETAGAYPKLVTRRSAGNVKITPPVSGDLSRDAPDDVTDARQLDGDRGGSSNAGHESLKPPLARTHSVSGPEDSSSDFSTSEYPSASERTKLSQSLLDPDRGSDGNSTAATRDDFSDSTRSHSERSGKSTSLSTCSDTPKAVAQSGENEEGEDEEEEEPDLADTLLELAEGAPWNYPTAAPAVIENRAVPVGIVQVAAGIGHSVFVTSSGEVWTVGRGDEGQLGRGTKRQHRHPEFLKGLYGKEIKSVACGAFHCIAISSNGECYAWGDNRRGQLGFRSRALCVLSPHQVQFGQDCSAQQAACGYYHSCILDRDNVVWTAGCNAYGQLGLDEDTKELPQFAPILYLRSIEAVHVGAGAWHTVICSMSGDVWTCGRNQCGQLGLGDFENRRRFQIVDPIVDGHRAYMCSAGVEHTVVATEENVVFAWGSGLQGQLGVECSGTTTPVQSRFRVAEGDKIQLILAGGYHSIIQTTQGEVWLAGAGGNGQLGTGALQSTARFRQIRGFQQVAVQHDLAAFPLLEYQAADAPEDDADGTEIERAAKTLALVPDNLREEFTDAELVEFVRSFEQLDLDGSGAIDEFEMGEAMKSLGEYPTEEQIKAAIAEVDENGNGEVEFDEFVMMIHKMRRGESVIKLDIVLSTIPSGNEVSDELRQVLDRKAGALVRANRRLEMRGYVRQIFGDKATSLTGDQWKLVMRPMGVSVSSSRLRELAEQYGCDIREPVSIQKAVYIYEAEASRRENRCFAGRMMRWRTKRTNFVDLRALARFHKEFLLRCRIIETKVTPRLARRLDVLCKPLTRKELTKLERRFAKAARRGEFDFSETGMRDTHIVALASAIRTAPIVKHLKLSRNFLTDAGLWALDDLLEWQGWDSNARSGGSGLGGADSEVLRPWKPPPIEDKEAVIPNAADSYASSATESSDGEFEALNEPDLESSDDDEAADFDLAATLRQIHADRHASIKDESKQLQRIKRRITQQESRRLKRAIKPLDRVEEDRIAWRPGAKSLAWDDDTGVLGMLKLRLEETFQDSVAAAEMQALEEKLETARQAAAAPKRLQFYINVHSVCAMPVARIGRQDQRMRRKKFKKLKRMVRTQLREWQASADMAATGNANRSFGGLASGGARLGFQSRAHPDTVHVALNEDSLITDLSTELFETSDVFDTGKDADCFDEDRLHAIRGAPRVSSLGTPLRVSRIRGWLRCPSCSFYTPRYTFSRTGLGEHFIRFVNLTQCRECDFEWMDAVHYITHIEFQDPIQAERLLSLEKYRLQTKSGEALFELLRGDPVTIDVVRKQHMDLVHKTVTDFAYAAAATATIDVVRRLSNELLRYGTSAFQLHHNDYLHWVGIKADKQAALLTNEFLTRMRAIYSVWNMPRDWPRFRESLAKQAERPQKELPKRIAGWTCDDSKLEQLMTALSKLSGAIETHYQRLQRHVEAKAIGAGLLHNAAVSRAGEVWTWGDGSEGRHGQGIEAPFTKPELLMLARPNSDDELLLSKRFESTQVDLMSHASLRSDWGCVEMHNGGYLLFDQAMGPKELGFSVARIVYWAAEYCTIILRRLDIEGPVVATLDLTPCRPLPEDRFEDAAQAEKRSQVFQVASATLRRAVMMPFTKTTSDALIVDAQNCPGALIQHVEFC